VHFTGQRASFVIERAPAGVAGASSPDQSGPLSVSSVAERVAPGLVDINVTFGDQGAQGAGTGMVLTDSGVVLTNNHVIKGETAISVTDVGNGQTYAADVVGYDRSHDVAVLQLQDASGLQTVPLGDSSTVALGESVTALGNAGGAGGAPHVAPGQVTALDQTITAASSDGSDAEQLNGLIQTDADIQPGDSGGTLVNDSGQVIGMDAAAGPASAGYDGLSTGTQGFAIPINDALEIVKQIEDGNASATVHIGATGYLGVEIIPVDQSSGGYGSIAGSQASGAILGGVASGYPAEQAGLAQGDVITSVDGQTVASATDLTDLLTAHHPGDSVQLGWIDASGQTHTAAVALVSGPPA
jgi:S1-C subfamily serine protease